MKTFITILTTLIAMSFAFNASANVEVYKCKAKSGQLNPLKPVESHGMILAAESASTEFTVKIDLIDGTVNGKPANTISPKEISWKSNGVWFMSRQTNKLRGVDHNHIKLTGQCEKQ